MSVARTAYYFFRRFLYDRDNGLCGICGKPVEFGPKMDIDHIVQLAEGGSDDPSNLRITHAPCNRRRHRIKGITTRIDLMSSEWQALKERADSENFELGAFILHTLRRMIDERQASRPAP